MDWNPWDPGAKASDLTSQISDAEVEAESGQENRAQINISGLTLSPEPVPEPVSELGLEPEPVHEPLHETQLSSTVVSSPEPISKVESVQSETDLKEFSELSCFHDAAKLTKSLHYLPSRNMLDTIPTGRKTFNLLSMRPQQRSNHNYIHHHAGTIAAGWRFWRRRRVHGSAPSTKRSSIPLEQLVPEIMLNQSPVDVVADNSPNVTPNPEPEVPRDVTDQDTCTLIEL